MQFSEGFFTIKRKGALSGVGGMCTVISGALKAQSLTICFQKYRVKYQRQQIVRANHVSNVDPGARFRLNFKNLLWFKITHDLTSSMNKNVTRCRWYHFGDSDFSDFLHFTSFLHIKNTNFSHFFSLNFWFFFFILLTIMQFFFVTISPFLKESSIFLRLWGRQETSVKGFSTIFEDKFSKTLVF